jgi:transcriptional regulator with XRE-family HTH domain
MKLKFIVSDFVFNERKRQKMTQLELSRKAQVRRNLISCIEDGEAVTLDNVEKILDGLGKTPVHLCDHIKEVLK